MEYNKLYDIQNNPAVWNKLLKDCNRPNVFIDSALIFTNAETYEDVNGKTQWKYSFQSLRSDRFAWTEFMRCAVSEATNQAPNKMALAKIAPYKVEEDDCEEYYQTGQANPNRDLVNIDIRQSCPMIPIFGDDNKTDDGVITAIAKQFVNTIDQKIEKICATRNTINTLPPLYRKMNKNQWGYSDLAKDNSET